MNLFFLVLTIHLLAAITWVGGMLFLSLVMVPALRDLEPSPRGRLFTLVGRQFRIVGWISIAVLVVTGLYLLWYHGIGLDDLTSSRFYDTPFGSRFAIKAAIVGGMIALSALHDFVLGPRSTQRSASDDDPAAATAYRRRVSWLARFSLLLGILVVAVSVELAR